MSVVYSTTANVAGAAIRNFRIESNRIESGRPIKIQIESRSFAGPYLVVVLAIRFTAEATLKIMIMIIDKPKFSMQQCNTLSAVLLLTPLLTLVICNARLRPYHALYTLDVHVTV